MNKRIISAFFAFAILICFVAPARADYHSTSNIWQWIADSTGGIPQHILGNITTLAVCPDSYDAKHHAASCVWDGVAGHYVCTCDICGQTFIATYSDLEFAYDNYVSDLPFCSINDDSSFNWTPTTNDLVDDSSLSASRVNHITTDIPFYKSDLPVEVYSGTELSYRIYANHEYLISYKYFGASGYSGGVNFGIYPNVIAPVDGIYSVIDSGSFDITYYLYGDDTSHFQSVAAQGNLSSNNASGAVIECPYFTHLFSRPSGFKYQTFIGYYTFPTFRVRLLHFDDMELDYSVDYRPTTISGEYSVVGDNNTVTVDNTTLFDETTNTFYNPVTGDTSTVENWSYDYSTRTYTMTDENDNSSSLTYGDDNIVLTDSSGNTFNIYYGNISQNGSGSGDNGGSSSDSGLFGRIGELLGSIVGGIIDLLEAFFSKILDHLENLAELIGDKLSAIVEMILGWFDEVPRLFSGFLGFLSAIFPFIPEEVMMLLTFGIAAVVFICIIKVLWRR